MPLKASPDGVALSLANKAISVQANAELLDSLAAGLTGHDNPRGYQQGWTFDHSGEVIGHAVANLRNIADALETFAQHYC